MRFKLLARWLILDIADIRDVGITNLCNLKGSIAKSNFLSTSKSFEIPIPLLPSQCINTGDRVKLTFYTRENNIKRNLDGTLSFKDEGMRVEKFVSPCWELIYEDFLEVT